MASSNLAIVLFSERHTALPSHLCLQVGVISLFVKSNLSITNPAKWNHAGLKELMQLFWRPTLLWENSSGTSCAQPWLHISISWCALKQKTRCLGPIPRVCGLGWDSASFYKSSPSDSDVQPHLETIESRKSIWLMFLTGTYYKFQYIECFKRLTQH